MTACTYSRTADAGSGGRSPSRPSARLGDHGADSSADPTGWLPSTRVALVGWSLTWSWPDKRPRPAWQWRLRASFKGRNRKPLVARHIRHACPPQPFPVGALPVAMVITPPWRSLMPSIGRAMQLPSAPLPAAIPAVGLAAVARGAHGKDPTTSLGPAVNGQENDGTHAPSWSPESPPALSPRAGKRTPSLGLKRSFVGTTPGPRLDARLHC
jgi:hypothetical protein